MANDNVVYFDRYAAFYLSHLFVFLENLAEVLKERYKIKPHGGDSRITSHGFYTILNWMQKLSMAARNKG